MTHDRLRKWLRRNWFYAALLLLLIVGYQLGKDRALRDNEAERSAATVGGRGDS